MTRQAHFCHILKLYQNRQFDKNVNYFNIFTSFKHCTEVRFANFLFRGFTTAMVVNPLERKLAKRTSVHCTSQNMRIFFNLSFFFQNYWTLRSYKYWTTWKLLIVTKMNVKNVLRYLHQKLIGKCWPSIHLMLFGAKICGCMLHIFLQNQLHTQLVCWLVYLRIAGN